MLSVDELLNRVDTFLRQGYRRTKIMPWHDVELVRAVRKRFGDISLMVYANVAYRAGGAAIFEELDAHGLTMLEDFAFSTDVEASAHWFKDDIIEPSIGISGEGFIQLAEGPGMGYGMDMEKVARYRIRFEEFQP